MNWIKYRLRRLRQIWRKYVVSIDWRINVLFIGSLVVVVLHDFIFAGSPELFSGGSKGWDLLYALCLQLIASYVFYFLVVHLKRLQDKEHLRLFLYSQTLRLAGEAKSIVRDFKEQSGHNFEGDFPPSEEDVQRMCLVLHPYGDSPIVTTFDPITCQTTYLNWLQYLKYHGERTKEVIDSIYTAIPFLDAEHLQIVIDVETCFHIRYELEQVIALPMSNTDLSFMASSLYDYFVKAKRAEEYAHKNLTVSGTIEPL